MATQPDARVGEGGGNAASFETKVNDKSVKNKVATVISFVDQLKNLVGDEDWQKVAYSDKIGSAPVERAEKQVGLTKLIRYGETDHEEDFNPAAILDVRVFIQGVDVSEDLRASGLEYEATGVAGHNTSTFLLDNSENKYVWTEDNLRSFYGANNPKYKFSFDENLEQDLSPLFTENETCKKAVYDFKSDPNRNPVTVNAHNVPLFAKYDLIPNKVVFQRNDPVRIWVLYPYRVPGNADTELWMPYFTGYVEYASVEEDNISGNSTVTLQCSDYRHMILERMRLSTDNTLGLLNPVDDLGFRNSSYDGGQDSFGLRQRSLRFDPKSVNFYDQLIPDLFGQPFSERPLEGAVTDLLVFKPSPTNNNEGRRGVQNCEIGGAFYFNATTRGQRRLFLEAYHKFTLFGPKRRPWTRAEVDEVGRGTTTDGAFAPHNFRLWFLLPPNGTGAGNLNDLSTISASAAHSVNWTNRLDVLRKLVSTLDYELIQSPTGDLHVEFNFADFRPEDFGEFKESFRFHNNLKNTSFGDEQSPDPVAALTFVTGFDKGVASKEDNVAGLEQKTVVFAPYIVARYGVTEETVTAPFLGINDKAVAQARAIIEFQKRNAECNTLSFGTSWRPFLLPNRPIHHIPRTRMGTTVSVSGSMTYGEAPTADVNFSLRHVRTFTGHYRSKEDIALANLDTAQREEYKRGGLDAATQQSVLEAMDDYESSDPLELQVYTSVMGGDFLPTTSRMGWGNTGVVAPSSGVYILDPAKAFQAPLPADAGITAHEATAEEEALPEGDVVEEEEKPATYKFASDPLSSMQVTSPFGGRIDPFTGERKSHHGTDFGAATGTPLYAMDDGTVYRAGQDGVRKAGGRDYGVNGIVVMYKTKNGKYKIACLHLDAANVRTGDTIKAGQLIGFIGNTGRSTGPHLHLEVTDLKTGQQVDPVPMLPGTVAEVA